MAEMSEEDFAKISGDSYRGSRYSNFVGGGVDPQGNVSSAATENAVNKVGTSASASDAPPSPTSASQGLTGMDLPSTSDMVVGAALPFAGQAVGQAAGASIGAGATFGEGIKSGFSSLANTASGGLIGTASTPTNIALGQMGGQFGPATPAAVNAASKASNIGQAGSGAGIGAAAGAGFATAAATLLTGGSVKDAAKSGIGTAAGTYIGNIILPGIGGFVGGFIGGSIFCFTAKTPILMEDFTEKFIGDLRLGDKLLGGGTVMGWGQGYAETLYSYKNAEVTGSHAVFEDGKWIRVKDSIHAKALEITTDCVVCPIATDNQVIITPWFVSTDIFEVEPEKADAMTDDERLERLNGSAERNALMAEAEAKYCINPCPKQEVRGLENAA